MWTLIRELRAALTELFPTRRDTFIVTGLVLFGAVVSGAEMLTAKLFSDIILPSGSGNRPMADTILLAVLFLVVFGGLRVVNYAQNLYRVNVFEKAFHGRNDKTGSGESWRWATAMELTTVLTMTARIAVIALVLFVISPIFGLANLVLFLLIAEIFGAAVRRQFVTQESFRDRQKAKAPASSASCCMSVASVRRVSSRRFASSQRRSISSRVESAGLRPSFRRLSSMWRKRRRRSSSRRGRWERWPSRFIPRSRWQGARGR